MIFWTLAICTVLLSLERIAYVWISRSPTTWLAVCRRRYVAALGDPVTVVRILFAAFKVLQLSVFFGWCMLFANSAVPLPTAPPVALLAGAALLVVGQFLNFSVFLRLGGTAVFFGGELGHDVPWISGFPFSMFKHPQYVGTVLSIWGFFLIMRFPHDDWVLLPLLETLLYAVGARLEN
jgi:methylene-fatty-acyl-phospholipid synthase